MKNQRQLIFILLLLLPALYSSAQPRQGQPAAEVALPAVNGDTLKLSSLKGKVVLLDFWASWCGPCRESNKELVKIYSKYKSKGFEIFGVSIDDQKNKWQAAIKKDKISWLQVNDNGGWDAKTIADWNINAIPTSYLIDKEGKLLAMDLEAKELERALKYLLEEK